MNLILQLEQYPSPMKTMFKKIEACILISLISIALGAMFFLAWQVSHKKDSELASSRVGSDPTRFGLFVSHKSLWGKVPQASKSSQNLILLNKT